MFIERNSFWYVHCILTQGVVFPALSAAVISWVPLSERARFMSFAVQGSYTNNLLAQNLFS